jgi:type I restriction enzyme R subunit
MAEIIKSESANFAFLAEHDPLLLRLCISAERNYHDDPNTTVIKLRQFGEAVVRHLAAVFNITASPDQTQADLLRTLQVQRVIDRNVAELLHYLRREGNQAAHEFETTVPQAKSALKIARELALWFHRALGKGDNKNQKVGPFVEPTRPDHEYRLAQLSSALESKAEEARTAYQLADAERSMREAVEARAAITAEEKTVWAQLAQEEESERLRLSAEFEQTLARVQAESKTRTPAESSVIERSLAGASQAIVLDESETRAIIDAQLTESGWEADTENQSFGKGARPEAGKCKAIAEWPTATGPADYILFHGLTPLAIVEAKKYGSDISGDILQAERYSQGYQIKVDEKLPHPVGHAGHFPGWLASEDSKGTLHYYRIPFTYATNGRPYLRQLETKSGIWFRDLRQTSNHARPLNGWHTPEHLVRLLESDSQEASTILQSETFSYLGLRDYQVRAVKAVEEKIAQGGRECLVAMATGTGKTRTIIGLIYRLLKAKRFQRVLFLVDRNSLGIQAQDAFKDMRLEQNQVFTEIYDMKELGDIVPDSATKVQVATVQGMVHRIFGDVSDIPIDRYDCIIVDEAHRGYILDREMGEGELEIRSEADYISSYRRVLDHFDAVKVALTATPAQHTVSIFGHPVYTYTYREAVIDGWLIDHEPPIRIVTQLAQQGIHFDKGASVQIVKPATGSLDTASLPDELDFEIDSFNRLVITENFNRIVCEELAKQLDPMGEQKTLIFCANDNHADLVVKLLKDALEAVWGQIDDKTVMKITGRTDKPMNAIRLFKNERLPLIAVTVDLLTTGIDVPAICNLVFLRRVRSRILYEQMLGRATRLCPDVEKEVFRIFDAVDIYSALDAVNTMKPVVQTVSIPLAQLFAEIADEKSHKTSVGDDGRSHADDVRDQIVVRLRNLIRRALKNLKDHPELKEPLDLLEKIAGEPINAWPDSLKKCDTAEIAALVRATPAMLKLLERLQLGGNGGFGQVISTHDDELISIETGYGKAKKPEDYLDSFRQFILENRNKIAALNIAMTRPRELTREDLRQLRLALANADFNETAIRTAWREAKSEDIAASIIGYIRQLALGSPLIPFEARVERALKKILASRKWPAPQQKWLERIAKEMKRSIIIDSTTFEEGAFKNAGGFKNLQHVFGNDALTIIDQFEDAVWEDAA